MRKCSKNERMTNAGKIKKYSDDNKEAEKQ
jgi:hypothetical protein